MALTAAEGLGPLPPAAGPRCRSAALAEARRRAGAVHGAALPGARGRGRDRGRGKSKDRSETRQRCSAFWALLGGRGIRGAFQLLTLQPPCRGPGTGPGRLCPRSLAPWARLAPARCRPQLHPGRAERQARPAGTGSPGGAGLAPRGGSEAAGAVAPPGPASLPPPGRPGRGPLPPAAADPGGCSGDAGVAGGQGRSQPGHDSRGSTPGGPRFCPGGAGSGPLRRAESGPGSRRGKARKRLRPELSGPARPRLARPCPGPSAPGRGAPGATAGASGGVPVRDPGEGAAPVPAGGRQPWDAAPGLSQAGWAGVTGLLMVILFISLAASPELCLQRGLVVPAAPALCLDRGLL